MALDGVILHQINQQLKSMLPAKINKIQQPGLRVFIYAPQQSSKQTAADLGAQCI